MTGGTFRTPILDDRSYAQLRDELVARIPVYAPEWTDHNPSDPGITLIELFAFLGENLLYRFNQIPDATRLAFLDLLQIPLRPAVAATGLVTFGTDRLDAPLADLHLALPAGPVSFQTLDETIVLPVTGRAAIRALSALPEDEESFEYLARASVALGVSVDDITPYETRLATGDPTQPGGDLLDPAATIDGTLFVALLAADEGSVPSVRAALAGHELSVGFIPDQEAPGLDAIEACHSIDGGAGAPVTPPMEWQISTTQGTPGPDGITEPVWRRLTVTGDTTSGLTGTGIVRLRLPNDTHDLGVFAPDDPDETGSGDQAPLVEDDEVAPRIVCWLRVFRPGGGQLAVAEWVGVNAARAEHAITAPAELLGTGTGQPGQQYQLVHGSVLAGGTGLADGLVLEIEEQGAVPRWIPWELVSDFRGSGIDDRHAVLEAQAGVIRFGDGLRGRAPQLGERIRVRSYRYGGGAEGLVAPGAITKSGLSGVTVTNPLPTRGGAAAETTAQGVARIPDEVRRHDRAVTAADFSELAQATPGADIARAESLPLFHPAVPTQTVPGAITVIVWPRTDRLHPGAPVPDRVQLGAVCRYLDERRLLTTELYVAPPTYRRIAVSAGIAVKPGYGTEAVRRWVEQILQQYLSPLPPYGPEGGGWPLGRRVHGPELEAAALQVDGVEYLNGIRLSVETDDGWTELTSPPTLELAVYEVPELADVLVVPGDAPVPGSGSNAPKPAGGRAVPVRPAAGGLLMSRPMRGLSGCDQWVRATHEHTTVDGETGRVGLSWTLDDIGAAALPVVPAVTRGLVFDRFCRAYRGVDGNVTRTLFGDTRSGVDYARLSEPLALFSAPEFVPAGGGFAPSEPVAVQAVSDPAGIAVDADDRLVVSERGRRRLLVADLWSRRVIRTLRLDTPAHPQREPWGIAADGRQLWVVTRAPAGLLQLTARGEPVERPLPVPSELPMVALPMASQLQLNPFGPGPAPLRSVDPIPADWQPSRVTVASGAVVVLFQNAAGEGLLVADGRPAIAVGPATDLTTDAEGAVVVAGSPGAAGGRSLLRFVVLGGRFVAAEPLDAAGYDGGGIALTHQGRIAYTTGAGLRLAVRGRLRYAGDGRVVTFRLDSGEYGTRWGRMFLDAYLPTGTTVRCSVLTSDDEDAAAVVQSPADPAGCDPYLPETSPPLPPPRLDVDVPLIVGSVQARAASPVPWWRRAADDCMTTYEGYPSGAAGRYAWIAVRLTGNTRATPLVGAVRIEAESHTLMRRLPKVFSADPAQESFLHRYLAMFDGLLHDLDQRALVREMLLDPACSPEEALGWLASFIGMVFDERWPVDARRQLLAEAATLYRRRGTLAALSRYLEIYLRVAPVIVEHYRLRGLAGYADTAGFDSAGWSQSVLGFGYRVGGAIGSSSTSSVGSLNGADNPFYRQAHRFSVIVPRLLDDVEDAVVRLVLDRERPAHTAYELCTVDAGMRVGRSMHLGLTSVVGRTGGFNPVLVGSLQLGGAGILGSGGAGLPGAVAEAARAGQARVG